MIRASLLLSVLISPAAAQDPQQAVEKMQWMYRSDPDGGMMVDMTKPIFSFTEEQVAVVKSTAATVSTKISSSTQETSDSLAVSFGLKGSYGAFSAAVSSSVNTLASTSHTFSRVDKNIKAEMYKVSVTTPNLYELVAPQYKDKLDSGDASEVVDFFGEFYATEATFGGLVSSIAIIEKTDGQSSTDVSADADVSFAAGGVKSGVETKHANKHSTAKATWSVQILGGDPTPWLKVEKEEDVAAAKEEWARTVQGDAMHPVDLKLRPLWTLLEGHNDGQAQRIQQYLEAKWADDAAHSRDYVGPDGPVPNLDNSQVVMQQPAEEKGSYECRETVKSVKELLDSRDGCWNFDQLTCGSGTLPFKWGDHCYGGRIHLPPGLCALLIVPSTFGGWSDICTKYLEQSIRICGTEQKQDFDFWDYDHRVCAFKFEKDDSLPSLLQGNSSIIWQV